MGLVEKLNQKDAELYRAFFQLVKKGKFDIQGEAIEKMGALFKWASTLDKKIEATLEDEKPKRKSVGVENGI